MGHTLQRRTRSAQPQPALRWVLRENGLSIALVTLFVIFLVGQSLAGILHYNSEQLAHGEATVGFLEYLGSAHFLEAVAENWESEFLQISAYVIFTAILTGRDRRNRRSSTRRRRWTDGGFLDLSAATRLPGVQAGGCAALRDRGRVSPARSCIDTVSSFRAARCPIFQGVEHAHHTDGRSGAGARGRL